ncbi:hypothetical protein MICAG_3180007 [Microcystis aeruginosa PCC 9808]|uniref:Uncharacterized protein n=1 Tax=Microcystis aeruginosa PCC 9808 TaxID=1160284 RepID=I4HX70_MICAE|nr:hypothetical protein MICAG_3180007 [Microcystis aeruginosa PCC 9808]
MGNAIKKDRWTINQDSYHLTLSLGKTLDKITELVVFYITVKQ